jgi:hypothetical protein
LRIEPFEQRGQALSRAAHLQGKSMIDYQAIRDSRNQRILARESTTVGQVRCTCTKCLELPIAQRRIVEPPIAVLDSQRPRALDCLADMYEYCGLQGSSLSARSPYTNKLVMKDERPKARGPAFVSKHRDEQKIKDASTLDELLAATEPFIVISVRSWIGRFQQWTSEADDIMQHCRVRITDAWNKHPNGVDKPVQFFSALIVKAIKGFTKAGRTRAPANATQVNTDAAGVAGCLPFETWQEIEFLCSDEIDVQLCRMRSEHYSFKQIAKATGKATSTLRHRLAKIIEKYNERNDNILPTTGKLVEHREVHAGAKHLQYGYKRDRSARGAPA